MNQSSSTLECGDDRSWQFWLDRGGTFTDVVGRRPDGTIITTKLLSENPEQYEDAAIEGIRRLLELGANEPLTVAAIESVKMGTTVATISCRLAIRTGRSSSSGRSGCPRRYTGR
jgi:hypothetical protein